MRDENKLFASDTKFLFMNGEHHLRTELHLVSLTNITLIGTISSDIIIDAGASIVCTNTSGFFLQSLKITHQGQIGPISSTSYSAIAINMSHFMSYNVQFRGLNLGQGFSRAINIIHSQAAVVNCSFYNGYSNKGGAVYVLLSNVTFCGDNLFRNNKASLGGAIFSKESSLVFSNDCAVLWNDGVSVCCSVICIMNKIYITQFNISYDGSYKFIIFFNNNADSFGGAITVVKSTAIFFGDINFSRNKVYPGGALTSWDSTVITGLSKPLPHNCAQFGIETFAAANNTLENKTNIIFKNNTADSHGGGWYSVSSNITITGTVNFTSNRAYRGGGLASHNSAVEFKSPLTLTFHSNTAKDVGGAIFYELQDVDPKATENNCFFKVTGNASLVQSIYILWTLMLKKVWIYLVMIWTPAKFILTIPKAAH